LGAGDALAPLGEDRTRVVVVGDEGQVAVPVAAATLQHLEAGVGGGVIQDEDLVDRVGLAEDGFEPRPQVVGIVVVGDDHGDALQLRIQVP
jgi:hypothetical protein